MQDFRAQTHLFSEVTGPQQVERKKKKNILLTPPPEGFSNNANAFQ